MSENYVNHDVPAKDPSPINQELDTQDTLLFQLGEPDRDQERDEEQDVNKATDALDAVSKQVTEAFGKGTTSAKFDERLNSGKDTPQTLWSDSAKKTMTKLLKNDPTLEKKVNAIFTENLGDELKAWTNMAKGGTVDRDTFLKADIKIAEIISSYDKQLAALAETADTNHSGAMTGMREALRSIARNMSYQTTYISQKGLWKSK